MSSFILSIIGDVIEDIVKQSHRCKSHFVRFCRRVAHHKCEPAAMAEAGQPGPPAGVAAANRALWAKVKTKVGKLLGAASASESDSERHFSGAKLHWLRGPP